LGFLLLLFKSLYCTNLDKLGRLIK